MGIVEFENNRLRQQEIEVRALIALLKYGTFRKGGIFQEEAEEALYKIAFPNKLAQEINQTKLGLE